MKFAGLAAVFIVWASSALAEQAIGFASIDVADQGSHRPLTISLWYPAIDGIQETIGGNGVFQGVAAAPDATPIDKKVPLVLLSHGGLRSAADSGAWLTSEMARAGYLVIEINGPRPLSPAEAVDEIWRRPSDISRALDVVMMDDIWSDRIDQDRISVVGYALGGTAGLALAGGEYELQAFIDSCSGARSGPDCGWYKSQNVNLAAVDHEELTAAKRDPRIGSAIAIEPEYLSVFADRLSSVDVPTLVISLGDVADTRYFDTDSVVGVSINGSTTSDGFQLCTAKGAAILAEDGGDPALCGQSAEARQHTHQAVTEEIVKFLAGVQGQ